MDELAATKKLISDDDKISWLDIGLGPKYTKFVDSQLSKPPFLLSPDFCLRWIIMNFEVIRYEVEEISDHNLTFVGIKGGRGRGRKHGRGGSTGPSNLNSLGPGFFPFGQHYEMQIT